MYCGQCASKLTEDAKFCGVCGSIVNKNLKNKNSKKKLIIGVVSSLLAIILIVGGVIGFTFILDVNSPDKTINNFFTAIRSNDIELIKELLVVDEGSSQSEDEYIHYLLEHYNENRSSLVADLNALKEDYLLGRFTTLPYYVIKEGNEYFIKIIQRELTVNTPYEIIEMRCFLGDEQVETSNSLLPGKYKLEIDYLDGSITKTLKNEIDLFYATPLVSVDLHEELE